MTRTASLANSRAVYEALGWEDTDLYYERRFGLIDGWKVRNVEDMEGIDPEEDFPAYDTDFLLEKLPATRLRDTGKQMRNENLRLWKQEDCYVCGYSGLGYYSADTPADALCQLALALAKAGVLGKTA